MTPKPSILITAGPTHEPIDAVRYIANRSSGSLGIALAEAAARHSLPTTLLLGPTSITPDPTLPITTLRFTTATDLQALLTEHAPQADLVIMAAAVADYRPATPSPNTKIPRDQDSITLTLEKTPDLVAAVAQQRRESGRQPGGGVIAFALEHKDNLIERATAKLARKGVDAIVANPLETMDAPTITAYLIFPDRTTIPAPPNLPKPEFGRWLLDQLL